MINIDKLIEALSRCPNVPYGLCYECCDCDCPYYSESGVEQMHKDAIELVRKQKPFPVSYSPMFHEAYCGACGNFLETKKGDSNHPNYCKYCGTKIDWSV